MRVLGVFIGVNAQRAPDLAALPFAGEDARALWSICADWNEAGGGHEDDCVLLTGAEATQRRIQDALQHAVARSHEEQFDLAIVHFAGHGTGAGTILGCDAVRSDPGSGVALTEIATAMSAMCATHTVLALDACFSGQAGFLSPSRVRQDTAVGNHLSDLANERRAVLWACGPEQRAWESSRLRHGLLTYGLVHALEQPAHVEAGDRIALSQWILQAISVTAAQAGHEGRVQTPGYAMLWQASAAVPRPVLGSRRAVILRERQIYAVGPAVSGLSEYEFPPAWIAAVHARIGGGELTDLQQRAIAPGGVLAGRNVIVSAPTSTGKTILGELAMLEAVRRGRRAVYLTPMRALAQEKFEEFRAGYEDIGLRVIRAYGGVNDDDAALVQGHYDIALMTYERCLGQVLSHENFFDGVGVVVLDEAHLLTDEGRGRVAEFLLMGLKARRAKGQDVQLVLLSAVLSDLGKLEEWLDAEVVQAAERPVQLNVGVLTPDGRYRYQALAPGLAPPSEQRIDLLPPLHHGTPRLRDTDIRESLAVALARKRIAEDRDAQVLIFRSQRPGVFKLAAVIGRVCALPGCAEDVDAHAVMTGPDMSRASGHLQQGLAQGVAVHVADLDHGERTLVEHAFREKRVRVVVATSTLAMGINTPATDVIIVDQTRYDGTGQADLPASEIQNMAGRAGRWIGGAAIGAAYLIAESPAEADKLWNLYITPPAQSLRSQISAMSREDLAVLLMATAGADTPESLLDAALNTFDGFQRGEETEWRRQLRTDLRAAVELLVTNGFVSAAADRKLTLTDAGRVCALECFRASSATRVLAAARDIITAGEPFDDLTLVALAQLTDELDGVYMPSRTRGEPQWEQQLSIQFDDRPALVRCIREGEPGLVSRRSKRLCSTLLWLRGAPLRQIEDVVGRFMQESTVHVGAIRGVAERSAQVIRAIAGVLAHAFPDHAAQLEETTRLLRPRLELGVPHEAHELTRCRLGLNRTEIVALRDAGVTTTDALGQGLLTGSDSLTEIFRQSRLTELRAKVEEVGVEGLKRIVEREDDAQRDLFEGMSLR